MLLYDLLDFLRTVRLKMHPIVRFSLERMISVEFWYTLEGRLRFPS